MRTRMLFVIMLLTASTVLAFPAYIKRPSCKMFATQQIAQAYFNYWYQGVGKPKTEKRKNGKALDRDGDKYACDCNKGSQFFGTKRCNKSKP
jgi:hypothetical protein